MERVISTPLDDPEEDVQWKRSSRLRSMTGRGCAVGAVISTPLDDLKGETDHPGH